MEFNIPILNELSKCKNLLIAGMGGGFDIFCGLPIYFELKKRGQNVHLANFSFADIENARHGVRLSPTLVGITFDPQELYPYFPEFYLAEWFKTNLQQDVVVWCFQKTGAYPLTENYHRLVEHLSIDGILLVDGGVDSLMRGNEAEKWTLIEDATSLFAVNELSQVKNRFLVCTAFGVEQDVTYAHVFENIAGITQDGGFLGVCSLTPSMQAYQDFESAVLHVQGKPFHDPSVINSSIISAVRGNYGDYHLTEKTKGSQLWISPLMPLYWFFDFDVVVKRNLFLSQLRGTMTFRDALNRVLEFGRHIEKNRSQTNVPL
jgi:hypothetical protein